MFEYESDFIVSCGSNDLISQQYCDGGSIIGARCIWTAGFLCAAHIYPVKHFVFYCIVLMGSLAACEKAGKRLTVKGRKITI